MPPVVPQPLGAFEAREKHGAHTADDRRHTARDELARQGVEKRDEHHVEQDRVHEQDPIEPDRRRLASVLHRRQQV
jgi:hypothetical protein